MMRAMQCLVMTVCCLTLAATSSATGKDDAWDSLHHVTRNRWYWLSNRELKCYQGRIADVSDDSITLKRLDLTTVTVERRDVLRLSSNVEARGTVFSGRSSWLDVTEIPANTKAHTRILMKNGEKHEGKKISFTDSQITLLERGKLVDIAKNEISKVYFDRLRPLTEEDQYALDELAYFVVFDPKFWAVEMNAGPKISVLLYDASATEDDAPIRCELNKSN
jgi:hypothetical protein